MKVATFTSHNEHVSIEISSELMDELGTRKNKDTINLYALPDELSPKLVDTLNKIIIGSTCAEQVWERFLPHLKKYK